MTMCTPDYNVAFCVRARTNMVQTAHNACNDAPEDANGPGISTSFSTISVKNL
jgi:hypothetical protein